MGEWLQGLFYGKGTARRPFRACQGNDLLTDRGLPGRFGALPASFRLGPGEFGRGPVGPGMHPAGSSVFPLVRQDDRICSLSPLGESISGRQAGGYKAACQKLPEIILGGLQVMLHSGGGEPLLRRYFLGGLPQPAKKGFDFSQDSALHCSNMTG
jgi:hypothetical protein